MKIYDFPYAPNPRKVRIYLAEKGIDMDYVMVDIRQGEQLKDDFLAINPKGTVPVLEFDSGEYISESLVIMEYLEELYPEPVMIGINPLARAKTRELERFIDTSIASRISNIFFNTSQVFQDRLQVPEVVQQARLSLELSFSRLDALIGENAFVAGDYPSIADCTLIAALEHGSRVDVHILDKYINLNRWYEAFKQRPSVRF